MAADALATFLIRSEQVAAIVQVLHLLYQKIDHLEADGQNATAYREVARWLEDQGFKRVRAASER